jgi:rhamnosyl/mannosyltransferase
VGEDEDVVLFVGRLIWYKGLDVLLDAFSCLDRGKLVILGTGPLEAALRRQARRLSLDDRVFFAGFVSHERKVAWLRRSSFLVMPSVDPTEGFGLVQVEAHLCERPVISTTIPSGVPWVNPHEETGLLVPPRDAAALAAAMARLLDDGALREELGRRARERALREFSMPVWNQRILAVCDDLLG